MPPPPRWSTPELSATALVEAFAQHPDYEIITSFPGLADISGAIVLAEIGDDRGRFADDRALQAFAGCAPVTRDSGKSRTVTRRRTKNNRLAAIGHSWAFTAAARPSATRDHYRRRRDRGDGHPAVRHLFKSAQAMSAVSRPQALIPHPRHVAFRQPGTDLSSTGSRLRSTSSCVRVRGTTRHSTCSSPSAPRRPGCRLGRVVQFRCGTAPAVVDDLRAGMRFTE